MKPATEKKVNDILNRAKNLKATYIREIRALTDKEAKPEDREVPRVSGIVIREGKFLLRIADKFIERHENLEVSAEDQKKIDAAKNFFEDLADTHADEISKNEFIYRLPVEFIIHLERIAGLILKFDASVKLQIAKIAVDDEGDDAELQESIDAEMIS